MTDRTRKGKQDHDYSSSSNKSSHVTRVDDHSHSCLHYFSDAAAFCFLKAGKTPGLLHSP